MSSSRPTPAGAQSEAQPSLNGGQTQTPPSDDKLPIFESLHDAFCGPELAEVVQLLGTAVEPFQSRVPPSEPRGEWLARGRAQVRFLERTLISRVRGVSARRYTLPKHAYTDPRVAVNGVLAHLYTDGYGEPLRDPDGQTRPLPGRPEELVRLESMVRADEGTLLHHMLRRLLRGTARPGVVVEVGFAHGVSAMYLGEALRQRARGVAEGEVSESARDVTRAGTHPGAAHADGSRHVILDPFQRDPTHKWQRFGEAHMNCAALPYELRIEPSWCGMAALAAGGLAEAVDFVFIDGAHAFDYTMVDLFMADRLLRPGGVVALDDGQMEAVWHAVSYAASNYSHWKLLGALHGNVVVFQKMFAKHHGGTAHVPLPFAGATTLRPHPARASMCDGVDIDRDVRDRRRSRGPDDGGRGRDEPPPSRRRR